MPRFILGLDPERLELPLHVWLELDDKGTVDLKIRDSEGEDWYVVSLTTEGTLIRHEGIVCDDFRIDEDGRVLTDDEAEEE